MRLALGSFRFGLAFYRLPWGTRVGLRQFQFGLGVSHIRRDHFDQTGRFGARFQEDPLPMVEPCFMLSLPQKLWVDGSSLEKIDVESTLRP